MSSENFNLKNLQDFVNRWIHNFIPEKLQDDDILPPQQKKKNYFLIFLKILPWISLIVFFITIFYDPFSGFEILFPWRESSISLKGVLRMLAVTGLVGYGTNYIAIKMLFHPREKRPILGQGLIPASKTRIAYRLGESISKEVINPHLIIKQIRETGLIQKYMDNFNKSMKYTLELPEFQKDLMNLIEYYVNSILRSPEFRENIHHFIKGIDFEKLTGLEAGLLKIYRFIGGEKEIGRRLEEVILSMNFKIDPHEAYIQEYLKKIPKFINDNKENIENIIFALIIFLIERINIKRVIVQNLLQIDELRLEKLILYSTSDQLDYIQYLGCLLGILGGLFIFIPYESFILALSLGSIIYIMDNVLYKLKR